MSSECVNVDLIDLAGREARIFLISRAERNSRLILEFIVFEVSEEIFEPLIMTESPQKFNKQPYPIDLIDRPRLFGCNWLAFVYDTRPSWSVKNALNDLAQKLHSTLFRPPIASCCSASSPSTAS